MGKFPKVLSVLGASLAIALMGATPVLGKTIIYVESSASNGQSHCADRGLFMNCSLEYLNSVCTDLGFDTSANSPSMGDDPRTSRQAPKGMQNTILVACE